MKQLEIKLPSAIGQISLATDVTGGGPGGGKQEEFQAEQINQRLQQQVKAELDALGKARTALEQACGRVQQAHQEFLSRAEEQLVDLAVEIAGRVLMQEIRAGRYDIEPIVRHVLDRVPSGVALTVLLNPADLKQCGQINPPAGAGEIDFRADASVPLGGCRVETPDGLIQTDAAEHLAELARTLKHQD